MVVARCLSVGLTSANLCDRGFNTVALSRHPAAHRAQHSYRVQRQGCGSNLRDTLAGQPRLAAFAKRMATKSNNGRHRVTTTVDHKGWQRGPRMSIGQLFKNPNQLTRSEDRQIEEAIAGLNAEFENLRQTLRGQVEEADVEGAEYTALLMATTMSQIAITQGAQRGDPKVISSIRQTGTFRRGLCGTLRHPLLLAAL